MREWNAGVYHRVSDPQLAWGRAVLDRLPLAGDELVLDIGCGTGRLTALLRDRLPRGRVVAVDLSANMLQEARAHLLDSAGARIGFVQADASALPFDGSAHAIFSTATLHWVSDHPRLFAGLFAALAPGGVLVAQCGGAGNVGRLTDRCAVIMREPAFAPFFDGWSDGWEFADAPTTAQRLRSAGFVDVATDVEPSPIVKPDAATYREFVAHVVVRRHLAQITDAAARDRFLDALTQQAAADAPAFELDYCRLNIVARRPAYPVRSG